MNKIENSHSFKRKYIPLISSFGVLCFFLFLALNIVFRFLLPYGDEPDFEYRINDLIAFSESSWFPYGALSFLFDDSKTTSDCIISSSTFSLWSSIDSQTCAEGIEQVLSRVMLTIFIASPLFFLVIFRRLSARLLRLPGLDSYKKGSSNRLDTLGISLLFPGMLFSIGVLAREQLALIISLLIFVMWGRYVIIGALLLLVVLIDLGNSIVVFFFVALAMVNVTIAKKFTLKTVLWVMVLQMGIAYMVGLSLLPMLSNVPILSEKVELMMSAFSGSELIEKYPIYLRPLITYMTFIFLTPGFIKVPVAYLLVGCAAIVTIIKIKNRYRVMLREGDVELVRFKQDIVLAGSAAAAIICCVFFFPTYANAKYYMFLLPFFSIMALNVFGKNVFLGFVLFLDAIVAFFLFLYRLS